MPYTQQFSPGYSQLASYSPTPGAAQTALAQSASMQGGDAAPTNWSGVGTPPPQGPTAGDIATTAGEGLAKAGVSALAKEGIGAAGEGLGIGSEALAGAGGALAGIGGIAGPALAYASGQYGAGTGMMVGAMAGLAVGGPVGAAFGAILGSAAGSVIPWGRYTPRPEMASGMGIDPNTGQLGGVENDWRFDVKPGTDNPTLQVKDQMLQPWLTQLYAQNPNVAKYGDAIGIGFDPQRKDNQYSIYTNGAVGNVGTADEYLDRGPQAYFDPNNQQSFVDAQNVIGPWLLAHGGAGATREAHDRVMARDMGAAKTAEEQMSNAGGGAARGGLIRNYARGGIVGFIDHDTPGRADAVKTEVVHGTYIFPADIVSGLGEGNSLAGRKQLDAMIAKVPEIPVGSARGGIVSNSKIKVALSGGEYAAPPKVAYHLGHGDVERGADELDKRVMHTRHLLTQHQARLPGPKR